MIRKRFNRLDGKKRCPLRKSPGLFLKLRNGQSVIEYAILIAIVAAALIAMRVYVERAVQANLKLMEERINASPQ